MADDSTAASAEDATLASMVGNEFGDDDDEFDDELDEIGARSLNDDDAGAGGKKPKGTISRFVSSTTSAFVRNFVNYGPPYTAEEVEGSLSVECSGPTAKFWKIHSLLNARVNPNIADAEDLYYTPMHHCARNGHFMVMRMLRRAGAKVNVTDELGQSPLILASLMEFPPDMKETQLKMIIYLLREGADVNVRDKGGFSAIDFAGQSGNPMIVKLLLNHGANVFRENFILVAKRKPILNNVFEDECYKLIYEKLQIEEAEHREREAQRAEQARKVAEEARIRKLHASLAKRREARIALGERKKAEAKLAEKAELRRKREAAEQAIEDEKMAELHHAKGEWVRGPTGAWWFREYAEKKTFRDQMEREYTACRTMMHSYKQKNLITNFDEKWSQLTSGGQLEMKWTKHRPFRTESDGESSSEDDKASSKNGNYDSEDAYDENDAALEGEDIDSVMTSLSGSLA